MTAASPSEFRSARAVHLCSRRRVWSSPALPPAEAEELHAEVRRQVAAIGDGPGLITFRCIDGRQAEVRARDLESIELRAAIGAPAAFSEDVALISHLRRTATEQPA